MGSIRQATEDGLNDFIRSQRSDSEQTKELVQRRRVQRPNEPAPSIRTNISVAQFDTFNRQLQLERSVIGQDSDRVSTIQLVPRGGTPLLEAMAVMIRETGERLSAMPEERRPGTVMFVVVTDGGENESQNGFGRYEGGFQKVADTVKHQEDVYKWQFVYLGANQDAIKTACDIGINMAKAGNYAANATNTRGTYSGLTNDVMIFKGMRLDDANATYCISANSREMSGDPVGNIGPTTVSPKTATPDVVPQDGNTAKRPRSKK